MPLYHVHVNNNVEVHHPKIQTGFHNSYFLPMPLNPQANAMASPCLESAIRIRSTSLFLSSYQ